MIKEERRIAWDILAKIQHRVEKQYARRRKSHFYNNWYNFIHSKRAFQIAYKTVLKIPRIIPKESGMVYMFVFRELYDAYRELKEKKRLKKGIKRKERYGTVFRRF